MGFWKGFFGFGTNVGRNINKGVFKGGAAYDKGLRQKVAKNRAASNRLFGAKRSHQLSLNTSFSDDASDRSSIRKNAQDAIEEANVFYNKDGDFLPKAIELDAGHRLLDPETTFLQQAGFTLAFLHVPTGREVEFKAFLDQISDAFTTNWSTESVYGRMDQIATFQNTQRAIAVSWIVPAASEFEAMDNMRRVQNLMQYMYPVYSEDGVLVSAPLLRLKFGNLIRDASTGKGLLGYVNGFTVDPDQDAGWITYASGPLTGETEIYPKALRLNCDFTVLHEHHLGFQKTSAGFVFGRSSDEIASNEDIQGIDFPYPAGAGDPNIELENNIVRVSKNSHYAMSEPGMTTLTPTPGFEDLSAQYKESIMKEGGTLKSIHRYGNYKKILAQRNNSKINK